MYRAMIIDDEEIVRWGIRDLIDWEAEEFILCEDGHDGRDGLKKLLDNKPDLVLVDIKMPGLSGLELIRAARETGFGGHFIILTGYSEFEFAKTAISLGVEAYLLKPVDEEELCGFVRKMRKELDGEREERRRRDAGDEAAREEVLRKVLLRMGSREELEKQMAYYGISFGEGILCVAILTDGGVDSREEDSVSCLPEDGILLSGAERPSGKRACHLSGGAAARAETDSFLQKAADFLRDSSLCQRKLTMDGNVILIGCGENYRSWVKKLSARNERIRAQCGDGLLIAVGNNVGNWYELYHSYQFAKFMLEQEFLLGQTDVLSLEAIEQQQKAENPPAEYFLMLAEVGDLEGIRESVEKYRTWCIRNFRKETDVKVQVLYNLMAIQNSIGNKYGICGGSMGEQMEKLNRTQRLDQLMELYIAILQDICLQIGKDGSDTVIKRMYYYMEKNYSEDLKLENFARMFNYNANYLGKMFRKETGDSFNNILDSIRIANAKRLLEESDLKVYQISEQVGYRSIDYFYTKFRKYVGVSPKEYQKEIQEKQSLICG